MHHGDGEAGELSIKSFGLRRRFREHRAMSSPSHVPHGHADMTPNREMPLS
jgi:hypothetical protein